MEKAKIVSEVYRSLRNMQYWIGYFFQFRREFEELHQIQAEYLRDEADDAARLLSRLLSWDDLEKLEAQHLSKVKVAEEESKDDLDIDPELEQEAYDWSYAGLPIEEMLEESELKLRSDVPDLEAATCGDDVDDG